MLKKALLVVAFVGCSLVTMQQAQSAEWVRGYLRSNGTYVQPYYRSNRDGNFYNNWSTYPNVNPYTGRVGTRRTPSNSYRPYGSYQYRSYPRW